MEEDCPLELSFNVYGFIAIALSTCSFLAFTCGQSDRRRKRINESQKGGEKESASSEKGLSIEKKPPSHQQPAPRPKTDYSIPPSSIIEKSGAASSGPKNKPDTPAKFNDTPLDFETIINQVSMQQNEKPKEQFGKSMKSIEQRKGKTRENRSLRHEVRESSILDTTQSEESKKQRVGQNPKEDITQEISSASSLQRSKKESKTNGKKSSRSKAASRSNRPRSKADVDKNKSIRSQRVDAQEESTQQGSSSKKELRGIDSGNKSTVARPSDQSTRSKKQKKEEDMKKMRQVLKKRLHDGSIYSDPTEKTKSDEVGQGQTNKKASLRTSERAKSSKQKAHTSKESVKSSKESVKSSKGSVKSNKESIKGNRESIKSSMKSKKKDKSKSSGERCKAEKRKLASLMQPPSESQSSKSSKSKRMPAHPKKNTTSKRINIMSTPKSQVKD